MRQDPFSELLLPYYPTSRSRKSVRSPTYPRNTQWIDSSTLTQIRNLARQHGKTPPRTKSSNNPPEHLNHASLHHLSSSTCIRHQPWDKMKRKLPITKRFRVLYVVIQTHSIYVCLLAWTRQTSGSNMASSCAVFALRGVTHAHILSCFYQTRKKRWPTAVLQ